MNNRRYLWALLAVAATVAGCSKDDASSGNSDRLVLRPVVEHNETRMTLGDTEYAWETGDRIGVFVNNSVNATQNAPAELYRDGTDYYFGARVNSVVPGDRIYAYYPYTAEAAVSGDRLRLPLPALQMQQEAGKFNGSAMPMAAVAASAGPAGGAAELHFVPMASVACFKIWSSNAAYRNERVTSVTFSAPRNIAGTLSIPYMSGDPATAGAGTEGLESSTITTMLSRGSFAPGTSKADAPTMYMAVPAMKLTGKTEVYVSTVEATYVFTVNDANFEFARNSVKLFSLDLGSTYAVRTLNSGWPFLVTIYDYLHRDPNNKYGAPTGSINDLIGYSVTLSDPLVRKYWVYYARESEMTSYSNGAHDDELTALVVARGEMQTANHIFDLILDQRDVFRVAVVTENTQGVRKLYRTHVVRSMRGISYSRIWN